MDHPYTPPVTPHTTIDTFEVVPPQQRAWKDMQNIYATFAGPLISEGAGKISSILPEFSGRKIPLTLIAFAPVNML